MRLPASRPHLAQRVEDSTGPTVPALKTHTTLPIRAVHGAGARHTDPCFNLAASVALPHP